MNKILVLAKNYSEYKYGYYHDDIVRAINNVVSHTYVYGPGYANYDKSDTIEVVLKKTGWERSDLDCVVVATSWDEDESSDSVDPHPRIDLSTLTDIPKVYFLNKEYKKFELRMRFIKKHRFDYISSVHPYSALWAEKFNLNIHRNHFGIDMERFRLDAGIEKTVDFMFTGSLHAKHNSFRSDVKQQIFNNYGMLLKSNRFVPCFSSFFQTKSLKDLSIHWAEFRCFDLFLRNLTPTGKKYVELLQKSRVVLNTPSADGIFNTRNFEVMATGGVIICPIADYDGLLIHNKNSIMYDPLSKSDFVSKLRLILSDRGLQEEIRSNGLELVREECYEQKVSRILNAVRQ